MKRLALCLAILAAPLALVAQGGGPVYSQGLVASKIASALSGSTLTCSFTLSGTLTTTGDIRMATTKGIKWYTDANHYTYLLGDTPTGGISIGSVTTPGAGNVEYMSMSAVGPTVTSKGDTITLKTTVTGDSSAEDRIIIDAVAKGAGQYDGTITLVDLTDARTWTFPNVSGNVITTGDTGTVTGTMILNDTVALGTDTSGDYVSGATDSTLTKTGTEGATLGINLANANTFTAAQTATRVKQSLDWNPNDPPSSAGTFDDEFDSALSYTIGTAVGNALDTRAGTGTAGTWTVTGTPWTVNQWKGYFLTDANNTVWVITSNTTSALSVVTTAYAAGTPTGTAQTGNITRWWWANGAVPSSVTASTYDNYAGNLVVGNGSSAATFVLVRPVHLAVDDGYSIMAHIRSQFAFTAGFRSGVIALDKDGTGWYNGYNWASVSLEHGTCTAWTLAAASNTDAWVGPTMNYVGIYTLNASVTTGRQEFSADGFGWFVSARTGTTPTYTEAAVTGWGYVGMYFITPAASFGPTDPFFVDYFRLEE